MSAAAMSGTGDHNNAPFREVPATKSYARFTDPAEATFAAYRVFVYGDNVMSDQLGQVISLALMRAVLINVRELDGYMARDDLSGSLMHKYPGLDDVFIAHPEPDRIGDADRKLCATCGQWGSEHRNPNGTACDGFGVQPTHGCADNPRCANCEQPRLHHGRRYTVACQSFDPVPLPEYASAAVARDMGKLSDRLAARGVPHLREYSATGAFRIHADDGPWVLHRMLDSQIVPGHPSLRFHAGFRGEGVPKSVGPMSAEQAARFFAGKPASA